MHYVPMSSSIIEKNFCSTKYTISQCKQLHDQVTHIVIFPQKQINANASLLDIRPTLSNEKTKVLFKTKSTLKFLLFL